MITASKTWLDVEVKMEELKQIVSGYWDGGDWLGAMSGESLIRTVEKSMANSAELRSQTNRLMGALQQAEAYRYNR